MSELGERRFGWFRFTRELLQDRLDAVQAVFARVVPFSVCYDFTVDAFTVQGVSTHFDPVEVGGLVPWYEVTFEEDDLNLVSAVKFKRRKDAPVR